MLIFQLLEMKFKKIIGFRMVLDPKSGGSHNDYGSISAEGEGAGGPSVEAGAITGDSGGGGGGGEGDTTKAMTQSDLYQRQPLLPDTGGWASAGHPMPGYCEDDDDKLDGLKRNAINSNGVVRIEVPSPLREELRFPKEKMKTFIGQFLLSFSNTSIK